MDSSSQNRIVLNWKQRVTLARSQLSPQFFTDFFRGQSQSLDKATLRPVLERFILVRVLILSFFLLVNGWTELLEGATNTQSHYLFVAIALTYALSLANAFMLRKAKDEGIINFAYAQLFLDVFLAAVASYVATSLTVISLFLLIIMAAAFVLGRNGAVIVAAAAGIIYSLLSSELILPRPSHLAGATSEDIIVVYGALVTVALLSSYIARRLELVRIALDQQKRSFSDYHEQQKQLIDGLSEGVITLDLESTITGINEAARAIMGLAEIQASQLIGKNFEDAFSSTEADELVSAITSVDHTLPLASEATLKRIDTASDVHVNFNLSTLNDRHGNASGRLLRFSDVSDYHDIKEQLNLHERMTELLADVQADSPYSTRKGTPREIVGASPKMHEVFELVDKISPSSASVLIYGESGTGKELIARSIHFRSKCSQKKFVGVNCGAIPENLIESEFFGHRKGAFTGASSDKVGLFKEAEGGTLFLDEVGELPAHLQTKLLRALQEKVIRPVGDTRDIPVNVRVVAATNRDLKAEIKAGRFREDLYYRLNVLTIELPPLRERKEDIPLLVKHFMQSASESEETTVAQISPEALKLLVNYTFPGNIRELENIISRALVLGGTAILPTHLPDELREHRNLESHKSSYGSVASRDDAGGLALPLDLDEQLADLERTLLIQALASSNGIKKEAAALLGLNFRSFRYRLKKYGLQESDSDL